MKSTLVWDWPIRIMHWLMVLLFTGLIITGKSDEGYMQYHFYMGYGLSAVVIARILYGFFGSYYALFGQFVKGPKETFSYAKDFLFSRPKKYIGHNPLGGLMVVFLLLALTVQWATGLFNSDDIFWFGPFSSLASQDMIQRLSYIHHLLPDWLLGLVAIHILAVFYHELCLKERLVDAMILGRKKHGMNAKEVKTPRWGAIFSLTIGLAWLAALWMMPI
ncbi:cytochrome b/b6 domain-containing protein [Marinomonas sp. 5E14-1]|uniref:cytochrome b/b6 domain-containing protein n=1 Tax=Marinomonas sp. 5E14-1 TaxID=3153922 RepID=UPI003263883D